MRKDRFAGRIFRSMFVASTFSMLVEYAMSFTDKIFAGHYLSETALSALTLTEPLTLLIAFISCLLCAGVGIKVTEAFGKGDLETAEKHFSQGVILAVGIGLTITAVYVAFSDSIVAMLAGEGDEKPYVADYFRFIRLLPLPMLLNAIVYPVVLYKGGDKYCNLSAVVSIFGNAGLSWLLVSKIGMVGIGIGTFVGSWAGMLPLIAFLFTKKGKMKFRFFLSWKAIRSMGVYSIGSSIIYLYMAVFQFAVNSFLLHRFGTAAIVIFTGIVNLSGLTAALSDGIGEVLLPMINMYRGEKNVLGEQETLNITLKASIAEGLIFSVAVFAFARLFPPILGISDPAIYTDFVLAIRIYSLCGCFFYILNHYVRYYLYIDKVKNSLVISLCFNLIFPLVFGIGGGLLFGMNGVWIGITLSYPLLLLCAYLVIRRQTGANKLCRFLDTSLECKQCLWSAPLTADGVSKLMDEVAGHLRQNHIDPKRINQVLLAIEETQMDYCEQEKKAGTHVMECTLSIEDEITLTLKNTAKERNAIDEKDETVDHTRKLILSGMHNKSYVQVNGTNRLTFQF